jgi:murein DD-endopeptidase MepM/ murein hydrolase activator NlpD
MRRNLNEQLSRIKYLFSDKKVVNEQSTEQQKVDDPKKADLVGTDVNQFFQNLDNIDQPLFQQQKGDMEYQKDVETVQMGLELLGYDLPVHGVDGLYGPETAQAVEKFKDDNNLTNDETTIEEEVDINEGEVTLIAPVDVTRITSKFGARRTDHKHPGIDIAAPSGTEIKSPADGKVLVAAIKNTGCGGTIQIEHPNGFTSRYCHCKKINVTTGQTIKQGDIIGLSGGDRGDVGRGRSTGAHVHFELKLNGKLVDPLRYINKSSGQMNVSSPKTNTDSTKSVVTPKVVETIKTKLEQKNVKPEDLKKLVDSPVTSGGGKLFTDLDLSNQIGVKLYSDIADRFIKTRPSNPLKITGSMLAYSAKKVFDQFGKYVPPELALAQLAQEGGFSQNVNAKPIRTKNPFNVGNVDSGKVSNHPNVQSGIDAYYNLMARNYITKGRTASDLINKFVNKNNSRYASDPRYEFNLRRLVSQINRYSQEILAANKNKPSNVS